MNKEQAAEVIGLPDPSIVKAAQCHQLANRAFRHLHALSDGGASHDAQVVAWIALVAAVQAQRPEWICEGPYTIARGALVFTGPNNYMIIFRQDGKVFCTREGKSRPSPTWTPNYNHALPLAELVTRLKT